MCGSIVCIAAVMLGIDAGWRPLPEGGVEYLIQIEPQLLETLESGDPIQSDIPPHVKNVRAYKITVGTDELPRELPPPADVDSPGSTAAMPDKPPAVPKRIQPDPAGEPIIAQQAAHLEQTETTPQPESKPGKVGWGADPAHATADQQPQEEEGEPDKPWLPLTLILFGLFASLGGNVFLGWITWDTRSRYRALLTVADDPASIAE
jgi:hypothetical protein